MKPHFYKEIRSLDRKLYLQALDVAELLGRIVLAFLNGDVQNAARLVDKDAEIDRNEIAIEEECLKILALYQPVAGDLRYVITVLKVNAELERIGDLAVDIAGFTTESKPASLQPPLPVDFEAMTAAVRRMLDTSIKALSSHNVPLAGNVIRSDRRIDELHERYSAHFPERVRRFPESISYSPFPEPGTDCGLRHEHCRGCHLSGIRTDCPSWALQSFLRGGGGCDGRRSRMRRNSFSG